MEQGDTPCTWQQGPFDWSSGLNEPGKGHLQGTGIPSAFCSLMIACDLAVQVSGHAFPVMLVQVTMPEPTDENHLKVILKFIIYVLIYTRATALVCGGQRSEENSLDLFPPYAFTRPAEQTPLPVEPCCWPQKPCFKLYALYFC